MTKYYFRLLTKNHVTGERAQTTLNFARAREGYWQNQDASPKETDRQKRSRQRPSRVAKGSILHSSEVDKGQQPKGSKRVSMADTGEVESEVTNSESLAPPSPPVPPLALGTSSARRQFQEPPQRPSSARVVRTQRPVSGRRRPHTARPHLQRDPAHLGKLEGATSFRHSIRAWLCTQMQDAYEKRLKAPPSKSRRSREIAALLSGMKSL